MQAVLLIKSIRVSGSYFAVGGSIVAIRQELKPIRFGERTTELVVYRGYDKDDNLKFEIESDGGLVITYFTASG